MRAMHVLVVGIAAAVMSCGGSSSGITNPAPPTGGVNILVQDFKFSPAVDTVKVGTTVQWVNDGPSEHSTTSDIGLWNSQGLTPPSGVNTYSAANGTFSYTFTQAGTYTYHCMFHTPAAYPHFVGTIVVTN